MTSKRAQEGYLLIDNRASPGVSAELIRASGKDAPIVGEGQVYECATLTCCHCGVVVILRPDRTRARGYCRLCDHYVCDNPGCNSVCRPFEGLLIEQQNKIYHAEQHGLVIAAPSAALLANK